MVFFAVVDFVAALDLAAVLLVVAVFFVAVLDVALLAVAVFDALALVVAALVAVVFDAAFLAGAFFAAVEVVAFGSAVAVSFDFEEVFAGTSSLSGQQNPSVAKGCSRYYDPVKSQVNRHTRSAFVPLSLKGR